MRVQEILERLHGVRRTPKGWDARCPAHDDKNASLGIKEGEDGCVLLHCLAGCETRLVCAALGIEMRDLFPPRDPGSGDRRSRRKSPARISVEEANRRAAVQGAAPERKGPKIHETVDAAVRAACWSIGQRNDKPFHEKQRWPYHDGSGGVIAYVIRIEPDDGARDESGKLEKLFAPIRAAEGGWQVGDPAGKWPLFNLPGVLASVGLVFVNEGEKKSASGIGIGLTCTASAHGASSPGKTDWSPLAGRDVVLLPDNDKAGHGYVEAVGQLLRAVGARSIRMVELPGLGPKGDLDDFIAMRAGQPAEAIRAEIEGLVATAPAWEPAPPVEKTADAVGTALGAECKTAKSAADEFGPVLIGDEEKATINQAHFAARYVADSGAVHDPAVRRFYIYVPASGLWVHQTDDVTVREIGLCFQRIVTQVGYPHLLAKRSASLLHGLCELARGIAERRGVFNQRRDVIHVANGMLALGDGGRVDLRPFAPDWYSRNRSEISWNPLAVCPRFMQELLLTAMDEDDARLIQRYVGQCLMGMNPSQTFLMLRGTPGGGKSTLANVIEGLIGRYNVTELRIGQLNERFELIRFVGRTLLTGKDVPGDFLNAKPVHVLKALVGGDCLEGEVKNGNESFSVEGRFNVLISTNTRLRVKLDSDTGAWRRRMLIVDYNRPKPAKPIPDFDRMLLRDEGEGILRWAVDGAIALRRDLDETGAIRLTEAQRRRVDDLLSESDSVRSFVRECVAPCHHAELAVQDLTAAYRDFCERRDWEPLRERQFQADLPDAMLEFHRVSRRNDVLREGKPVRGFRGVRLVIAGEKPPEPVLRDCELPFPDASDGPQNTYAHTRAKDMGDTDCANGYVKGSAQSSEASDIVEGTL